MPIGLLTDAERNRLNHDLILGRWDDLVQLAASLKMGWATASLLVGKLQSHRRQNAVLRVLQEYGRLIKTIHIVRCLDIRSIDGGSASS